MDEQMTPAGDVTTDAPAMDAPMADAPAVETEATEMPAEAPEMPA